VVFTTGTATPPAAAVAARNSPGPANTTTPLTTALVFPLPLPGTRPAKAEGTSHDTAAEDNRFADTVIRAGSVEAASKV
jgi:hypothetical protein